jgi:Na+/melibiose symporter-like transporter
MKKLTIFRLAISIIGWLISFQLMPLGLNLMSKPSHVTPILGLLVLVATIGTMFYCAFHIGIFSARLVRESRESKKIKQDKK